MEIPPRDKSALIKRALLTLLKKAKKKADIPDVISVEFNARGNIEVTASPRVAEWFPHEVAMWAAQNRSTNHPDWEKWNHRLNGESVIELICKELNIIYSEIGIRCWLSDDNNYHFTLIGDGIQDKIYESAKTYLELQRRDGLQP